MRIGIDIMGGDYSPGSAIKGSLFAVKELDPDTQIVFFGNKNIIHSYANENDLDVSSFEIIHSEHQVGMGDQPLKSYKRFPDASIFLGQKHLSQGLIDGFCSAGNTGALLVGATQIVLAIPGIIRPAISATIPNFKGNDSIILDVGLNPDARPDVLYQYGILGNLYAKNVNDVAEPRVSLLNIGQEEGKGNLVMKSAYQLMSDSDDYNFTGNLEANTLFMESATDVLVCDGFVGNIVLKEAEAFYNLISSRNICNGYFEMFNFENFGGTPVLGIGAPLIIGHGISTGKAIKNMILETKKVIESGFIENIKESFNT